MKHKLFFFAAFLTAMAMIQNASAQFLPYANLKIVDESGNPLGDTIYLDATQPIATLCAEPYIPVQYFNGTYSVDQIPYNPADTTFALGTLIPTSVDDAFANEHVSIPFPFYFFGIRKNQFRVGDNGLVTFCSPSDFGSGYYCPYSFRGSNNQLPWNETSGHMTPTGQGDCFNRMHDAIYGVYEDKYTGPNGAFLSGDQGVYYGIFGQYPCRRIIVSWNEIPVYNNQNIRQSYQIVCYEGTNIIEVHIKHRGCCPSISDALIGIQNATGQPQMRGVPGHSNMYVTNGAPAAFWPEGRNGFTSSIDSVAYRFTPQGNTSKTVMWYRVFDDGRDSVVLTENINDTNGYFEPMHDNPAFLDYDTLHPTRTKATISPTVPSRYVVQLFFLDAENNFYTLRDTVVILRDTDSIVTRNCQVTAVPSNDTMGVVLGSGEYVAGSTTTLIAAPFAGFAFNGWDNGAVSNPYPIIVDSSMTIMANFSQLDTIWLHDTITIHDTIIIHDTIVVGIDDIESINAKIYQRNGQVIVDGTEDNAVTLYDVNGQVLATKQGNDMSLIFEVPATGTYMIKIGSAPARKVVVIR